MKPSPLILLPILFLFAYPMSSATSTNSFPLWPGGAPGARGTNEVDIPTLTPYFDVPTQTTPLATIIICPGGGYGGLAPHEGVNYARWLNSHGIAAFVLKYRLGSNGYRHPAMLEDAKRAMRTVRSRAAEWNVDPHRIGIMGSSAGGHLASTLLTHFDTPVDTNSLDSIESASSRPDFGVLCYAVIDMGANTHQGSKNNLLGANPPADLVELLSNQLHVTKATPPCFIWHTAEDSTVKVVNSIDFAAALSKAGVPFDLHVYEKGGHGLGLGSRDYDLTKLHPWTADFLYWLQKRGYATR